MGGGTDKTPSTHDGEIDKSIPLFTESIELCGVSYTEITGYRMAHVDGDNLTDKGEKDEIIRDKDEI